MWGDTLHEVVILHQTLKLGDWVSNAGVGPQECIKFGMYRLGPLLPHKSTACLMHFNPFKHMLLKHVHFYSPANFREFSIKGLKEDLDGLPY